MTSPYAVDAHPEQGRPGYLRETQPSVMTQHSGTSAYADARATPAGFQNASRAHTPAGHTPSWANVPTGHPSTRGSTPARAATPLDVSQYQGQPYIGNYDKMSRNSSSGAVHEEGREAQLYPAQQPTRYGGYSQANRYSDYGNMDQYPPTYGARETPYADSDVDLAGGGDGGGRRNYNDYFNEGPQKKKHTNKTILIIIGIVVIICVILAAVLGGVLGSRSGNDHDSGSSQGSGVGLGSSVVANKKSTIPSNIAQAAAQASKQGKTDPIAYQGTDLYGNPIFVSSASDGAPSGNGQQVGTCGKDPWSPSKNLNSLREHPRLIAPQYQWDCLASKIQNDAYLTVWNYSIFQNATNWEKSDPVKYDVDGGLSLSGILDVSRIVQQRIKAWGYAYRMTKDKKWSDRAYKEMQTAAGNGTSFGDPKTRWNPDHFLDTAEMAAAFAFGYDWMYDAWSPQQRSYIQDWIVTYGLSPGLQQYTTSQGWWTQSSSGNGNWNCVCNGGLIFAALALQGDVQNDAANTVNQILSKGMDNVKKNCMTGVYNDGTWSETPNYWYFGTNAQARLLSGLITATGTDQGLMQANPNWYNTGDFHMYVTGNAGMFFYGDNGPNKYSTTANQMFLYAQMAKRPIYALFQRDRADAQSDPLSMFWYDTSSKGGFWNGLALDKFFDYGQGSWVSMRSSWTDMTGTYVAMKASNLTGHQTHGDLDAGDFVIDALGTRFAGEYGSDNYLSKDYFASESQSAARWTYYRKGTQGQNTLIVNNTNQNPNCQPKNKFESTNPKQSDRLDYTPQKTDVAYFVTDLSSCYNQTDGTIQRGIRYLNGRRQVLLQDDIKKQSSKVVWRVHTNGTVSLSPDKRTATLEVTKVNNPNAGTGQTGLSLAKPAKMVVQILQPSGVTFKTRKQSNGKPAFLYGQNQQPQQDQDQVTHQTINPEVSDQGVTVLSIELPENKDQTLQVWWQPQYDKLTDDDKAVPKSVPLSQWSLKSH